MVKLFKILVTFAAFIVLVIFAINVRQSQKDEASPSDENISISESESKTTGSAKLIIKRYNLKIPSDKSSKQTWNEVTLAINEFIKINKEPQEKKPWVKIIKSKGLITISATNQAHIKIKTYLNTLQNILTKQIKLDIKIVGIVGHRKEIDNIIGKTFSDKYDNIYIKGFSDSFYSELSQNQSTEKIINNLKSVSNAKVISFNFNAKNGIVNKQNIKTIPGIRNATLSTLPYIGDLKSQVSLRLYFSKDIIDQTITLNHNTEYMLGGFAEKSNIKNLKKLSYFSNLIDYRKEAMLIIFIKPTKV